MKLSVGKRILMFLHWLLSLLICAAFAVYVIAPDFVMRYYAMVEEALGVRNLRIIGIAALAVYALLAIVQVCMIFKRKKRAERGFITVDSSDNNKVRIAVSAIEQMVRQSVNSIDGITDMKIAIDNLDDAIAINVIASIVNGSHVPTITMNMQRSIRQFVEMNCGVAVRAVTININAVSDGQDGSRRRRGRKKAVPAAAAPEFKPYAAADEPVASSPALDEPVISQPVSYEPIISDPAPVEPVQAQAVTESTPYDFEKPYESEFAKDFAAMKASEAASESDDAVLSENPDSGEDY